MDELTRVENRSIRAFVQSAADDGYLSGTVIDVGCGKQPYRDIVEAAGGLYYGYDRKEFPANVSGEDVGEKLPTYESALCTQVIQYVHDPHDFLAGVFFMLKHDGHLVLTYPTNWPEVNEGEDLFRFTRWGMERLLTDAGFTIIHHKPRHSFVQYGYEWVAGYGVIAKA